jgi:prepilin-type N-terminal cleavage/methylation domain-containing protein
MKYKEKGFTLIELLIVVAIIAVLISILAPALQSAREQGKRALCLYNTHALSVAWIQYIEENKGLLPDAAARLNPPPESNTWIQRVGGSYQFHPNDAPEQLQLEAIRKGSLFKYTNTTNIYRCPVAKVNEKRTYSLTHAMHGYKFSGAGEVLTKLAAIQWPEERINFLDDYGTDWDGCWAVVYIQPIWWNITPIRHGYGNTFAFADGHSEWWKWQDERTINLAQKYNETNDPDCQTDPTANQPNNPDLMKVTRAVWGGLGY